MAASHTSLLSVVTAKHSGREAARHALTPSLTEGLIGAGLGGKGKGRGFSLSMATTLSLLPHFFRYFFSLAVTSWHEEEQEER